VEEFKAQNEVCETSFVKDGPLDRIGPIAQARKMNLPIAVGRRSHPSKLRDTLPCGGN
jgi:hypothetical protein